MKPRIIFWNTIFLAYIGLVCLGVTIYLGSLIAFDARYTGMPTGHRFAIFASGGLPTLLFSALFFLAAFAPPRPWVYKLRFVCNVISIMACLAIPFNFIFLFKWSKPEIKAYYQGPTQNVT